MKNFLLKVCIQLLRFIYLFIKLFPTQNKIVMISRQSNNINSDFKLLQEQLQEKCNIVILCKTLDGGSKASIVSKINYGLHMFKQMYHIATSKVCLLDSYCPTISILNHKKSLTVIQMWHSIGTMKKFGYTSLGKRDGNNVEIAKIMRMHNNYDVVYCAGKAYKKHLQKGFGVSQDKIKIYTLPRVDLLKSKEYEENIRKKIFLKYPNLEKKQNILYAPTFRKRENELEKQINNLIDNIDFKKYNLIIKLHPLSKIKINNSKAIIDNNFSTFDMLFIADKIISDYSCIIYEAGIRNIPIYFFSFDYKDYDKNVGFAIDFKILPGYNEEEACKLAESLEKEFDMSYQKQFISKYVNNTSLCAKKMAEDILSYM